MRFLRLLSRSSRSAAALLLAAQGLLFGACVLDLDGLATGGAGPGSGGSAGSDPDAGSNGGGTPDGSTACAPLDCTACAAACDAPPCTITPLATGADADGPSAIAVSAGSVYWVNQHGNTVLRRTAASAAPEVLTTAVAPVAVAASGGFVVWAEQNGLWGCPADACDTQKKEITPSLAPGSLKGVAFDGQLVYFTDRGAGPGDGKVLRCPPDDCAAPDEIASDQLAPHAVALNATTVFWTDMGTGDDNGNVFQGPKTGNGYTQITASLVFPTALAADDTNVYFTRWSEDGKVLRCPHLEGYCRAPEEVASAAAPLARPLDVAIAGGRVYWSNDGDGTIVSCPLSGCGQSLPRVHASGRDGLRRIALGSSCLFWVDDTSGGGVFETPR